MTSRRARVLLTLATSAVLVAPVVSSSYAAERVTTSNWTSLTSSASPNFAQAAVARTSDGVQHVVWVVDNPDRTHNYEHTTISPSGVQGPVTRVLPANWAQLSTPVDLGVNADGSLRLAFRGNVDGGTADLFAAKGVYSAVSADGGASWVVPREVLAKSIGDGGVTMAYLPDGTPITGYGDTGGFHWNVGTVAEASVPTATLQEFTDHDAMAASLVTSGAAVYVVYQSVKANGVFARQVWPSLGAPIQARGTYTNPGQPMPVVDRPGVGPVAAYTVGSTVYLWDILANRNHKVRLMTGPNNLALTALPDGHMFVAAQGPIGYTPRVSRVARTGWRIDRRPALLDDMYSTFGIEVVSAGPLRAEVLLTGNDSGQPPRVHAQSALAQFGVLADPRRLRVGHPRRVTFTVTDIDGPVRGAKVRVAGKRCVTNGRGVCKIRFGSFSRPVKLRIKVTKASYAPGKASIQVKR